MDALVFGASLGLSVMVSDIQNGEGLFNSGPSGRPFSNRAASHGFKPHNTHKTDFSQYCLLQLSILDLLR
jgi:hypothetical protein